jgi:hypothetical protein
MMRQMQYFIHFVLFFKMTPQSFYLFFISRTYALRGLYAGLFNVEPVYYLRMPAEVKEFI